MAQYLVIDPGVKNGGKKTEMSIGKAVRFFYFFVSSFFYYFFYLDFVKTS